MIDFVNKWIKKISFKGIVKKCDGTIDISSNKLHGLIEEIIENIKIIEGNIDKSIKNLTRISDIPLTFKPKPSLFQLGNFKLASGQESDWKIDCDALTFQDWETLAFLASKRLGSFGSVLGVPTGGLAFAKALEKYITTGPLLIAEDVVTTGTSMEKIRNGREAIGIAVFVRGNYPNWVLPLFYSFDQFYK